MVGQRIQQWWRKPDHYEWLSAYVENRGLQPYTRIGVGLVVFGGGLIGLSTIRTPSGPTSAVGIGVTIASAILATLCSMVWLTHWPRHRESTVLVSALGFCAVGVCVVQPDPKAAALSGFVFALIAGYVAFFHTSKYLAAVLVVATIAAATVGMRLAAQGDPQLGMAVFMGLVSNTLILPTAIHILVKMLVDDSAMAHLDPLTELPNRRGLERAMKPMLNMPGDKQPINVILLDLDNFKRINDTFGHAAGDQVLMDVATIIRDALPDGAVAARIGGEEFVIAIHGLSDEALKLAERLRHNIAAKPWNTTASLGIAHTPPCAPRLIEQLLAAADEAMYTAKRAGGNQVAVHRVERRSTPTGV